MNFIVFIKATRPQFLTASLLPVILGSFLGAQVGDGLDYSTLILALIAMALIHAGSNVINDVADDTNGTDRANAARHAPFAGGSRMIQQGELTHGQMLQWGIFLIALSALPGLALIWMKGFVVLGVGLIGVVLAWAYSFPPFKLAARGLGEITIGLTFGLLPVLASAWLQSGIILPDFYRYGLAVSLWIACVLMINCLPDARFDEGADKRTLAVRLGVVGVQKLYLFLQLIALGLMISLTPTWMGGVVAIALFAIILWIYRSIPKMGAHPDQAIKVIKANLNVHGLGCIWLLIGP